MSSEYAVAKTTHVPSAISISRLSQDRYIVAWSADGDTWFSFLNEEGIAISKTKSIGKLRSSDSPIVAGEKTFWPQSQNTALRARDLCTAPLPNQGAAIAVLVRPEKGFPGGAYLSIITGHANADATLIRLGSARELSERISMTVLGNNLLVAWQEGAPEKSRIIVASVELDSLQLVATKVVDTPFSAFSPTLESIDRRGLLVWSEMKGETVESGGSQLNAVTVSPDLSFGQVQTIADCNVLDADPVLSVAGDQFAAAFRDNRDDDQMLEFYFVMLNQKGRPENPPRRISRADGPRGPQISVGGDTVFSAQIRSYQENLLVGFNRFDVQGTKKGGEFQVYADKSRFVLADLHVANDDAILIYAEDSDKGGRILSARISCRE